MKSVNYHKQAQKNQPGGLWRHRHGLAPLPFFCLFLLVQGSIVSAQYLPVWNSYQDHGLSWNPAYAGSHDAVSLSAFYRRQWMEIPEGPSTAAIAIHAPLWNQSIALGTEIISDRLGPLRRDAFQGHVAWRAQSQNSTFSIGVNGGAYLENADFATLDAALEGDPAFDLPIEKRWDWNAGAGFMLYNNWLMTGASAMDLAGDRQYFGQAAALIRFGQGNGIRPGAFLRYPEVGEPQADIGLQMLFIESVWVGANYRTNGDLIFNLLYRQKFDTALGYAEWGIGYNYQITNQDFRVDLGGSHEVQLTYRFQKNKTRELGPRFF